MLNDKISRDILWVVFDFYAETDGRQDPLEKLLGVCKYWSLAARQHRRLWTKFPMKFLSNKDIKFWCSCTSKRIELCGEDGPGELEFSAIVFSDPQGFDTTQPVWIRALSRPTPNLKSLKIHGAGATEPILPFAPSLEELTLSNCDCQVEH
ncbi:12255_t:CDS:2, partial [Acaulospora colombiana]